MKCVVRRGLPFFGGVWKTLYFDFLVCSFVGIDAVDFYRMELMESI